MHLNIQVGKYYAIKYCGTFSNMYSILHVEEETKNKNKLCIQYEYLARSYTGGPHLVRILGHGKNLTMQNLY